MEHADRPDAFDPLVVNPGRLSILTALAAGAQGAEFVHVRRVTRLTDGNLASHARRLADGGLIDIQKQFRNGKPVTSYLLTPAGRDALAAHVRRVTAAVAGGGDDSVTSVHEVTPSHEVRRVVPAVAVPAAAPAAMAFAQADADDSDWID